eukprot:2203993-Rhodomonas_salina.1
MVSLEAGEPSTWCNSNSNTRNRKFSTDCTRNVVSCVLFRDVASHGYEPKAQPRTSRSSCVGP